MLYLLYGRSFADDLRKWCVRKAFVETMPRIQGRIPLQSMPSALHVELGRNRHRLMHKIVFIIVRNRFGRIRGVDVNERIFFVEVVGDDYGEFRASDLVST